jgi:hypothetical protein
LAFFRETIFLYFFSDCSIVIETSSAQTTSTSKALRSAQADKMILGKRSGKEGKREKERRWSETTSKGTDRYAVNESGEEKMMRVAARYMSR